MDAQPTPAWNDPRAAPAERQAPAPGWAGPVLHALLIEAQPEDAGFIQMLLEGAGSPRFTLHQVETLTAAVGSLAAGGVDVVISDLSLPDSQGLQAILDLRARFPETPMVILTGLDDEDLGRQAVQAGAQDYLVKSQVTRPLLVRALLYAVERMKAQAALSRSEARYRLLAENVTDVLWTMDLSLRFTEISPSVALLTGFSAAEALALRLDEILTPASFAHAMQTAGRELTPGRLAEHANDPFWSLSLELEHHRKGGDAVWAEVKMSLLYDPLGQPYGILGISRDISRRKAAEAALENRAQELAELYAATHRYARQMALLNEITRVAIQAPDLQNMLQSLADRLGELFDAEGAYMTLWDEAQQLASPAAAFGPHRELYPTISGVPGERSLTRSVLEAGHVLAEPDVFHSPYLDPGIAALFQTRSMLALPLIAGGCKLGAALISFNQAHAFSEEEIRLGEQVAAQVALAVVKVQAFEAERQRRVELARSNALIAALSQVAARLQTTLDPDQVMATVGDELKRLGIHLHIALFEPGLRALALRYTSLDGAALAQLSAHGVALAEAFRQSTADGTIEKMITRGRPLFRVGALPLLAELLPQVPGPALEAALASIGVSPGAAAIHLPLLLHDRALGLLSVWGSDLHEQDVPAFTIFANQVAVALENARLYSEIQALAILDELTGLYNRRGFFTLAEQQLKLAERAGYTPCLFFLDVDHLKRINDTFGHQEGDQALLDAAAVLRKTFRSADLLARIGGDEFAVLTAGQAGLPEDRLVQRLEANLLELNRTSPRKHPLSISVGRVLCTDPADACLDQLLARADANMYAAKRARNGTRALGQARPEAGSERQDP